jgi:nitronate monooxygenase
VKRQELDTVLYGQSLGLQGRGLKNKTISEIAALERRGAKPEEIIPLMSGLRGREAWKTGDVDSAPLMVGQSIGLIRDIPTCRELLDRMAKEAKEYLDKAGRMIQ